MSASPRGTTAATTSSTTTIDGVLRDIDQQQDALKRSIGQSKALLDADSAQQKQLQTNVSALVRTASDLIKAREDGQKASEDAGRALDAAKTLIDEMDTVAKKSLDTAIAALDTAIATQKDTVAQANKDVDALLDQLTPLQHSVDVKSAAFDTAVGNLTQLAATIRASIGRVQKLTTDLRAATDAGQIRKVYVLFLELTRERGDLNTSRAATNEATLVSTYKQTANDLKKARDALAAMQGDLADKKATLDSATKTLTQLQADRDTKLKDLMVRQDDPAPQAASAPAASATTAS